MLAVKSQGTTHNRTRAALFRLWAHIQVRCSGFDWRLTKGDTAERSVFVRSSTKRRNSPLLPFILGEDNIHLEVVKRVQKGKVKHFGLPEAGVKTIRELSLADRQ